MTKQNNDLDRFFTEETRKGVRFLDPAADPPLGMGVKYDRNPILRAPAPTHHICHPQVIHESDRLYMFYNGYNGDIYSSGIAFSKDLRHWEKYDCNPIFTVNRPKSWESRIVDHQFCLPYRNRYYVWYSGADGVTSHIGLVFLTTIPSADERMEIEKLKKGGC